MVIDWTTSDAFNTGSFDINIKGEINRAIPV